MNKKITFDDIARYTNFSKTTISRYFNNPNSIKPKNQKIISDAMISLNYKENKLAKILANGKTEFVGIIVPNFFHQFYSNFINHLIDTYDKFGFKFIVFLGKDNVESEREYIKELLSYQIEGLIELSHNIPSSELKEIGIPVVSIEREDQFISSVNTNNYRGAELAAMQFIQDECDILIHIHDIDDSSYPGYNRITGFENTCQKHNKKFEVFIRSFNNQYHDTYQTLYTLYQEIKKKYPRKKKGVFLCNDTYAHYFVNILISNHEAIPDEYEIIGFDNSPVSEEAILPFSTIGQNIPLMVLNVINILQRQIESKNSSNASDNSCIEHIIIEPSLILRQSTINKLDFK